MHNNVYALYCKSCKRNINKRKFIKKTKDYKEIKDIFKANIKDIINKINKV